MKRIVAILQKKLGIDSASIKARKINGLIELSKINLEDDELTIKERLNKLDDRLANDEIECDEYTQEVFNWYVNIIQNRVKEEAMTMLIQHVNGDVTIKE